MESEKSVDLQPIEVTTEEKQWASFIHLSSFLGYISGIGFILAPLILWMIKKDSSSFIDHHGKEAMNFQISMFIYLFVSVILIVVLIGLILFPALLLAQFILMIFSSVQASNGEKYRYPLTIRFFK